MFLLPLDVAQLYSSLEFYATEKESLNVCIIYKIYCTVHNVFYTIVVVRGEKAKHDLESRLLELDSSSAVEATTTFIISKSPIPTASNESLNSVANVEEKSQHLQDNSTENSEISSLPKANEYVL